MIPCSASPRQKGRQVPTPLEPWRRPWASHAEVIRPFARDSAVGEVRWAHRVELLDAEAVPVAGIAGLVLRLHIGFSKIDWLLSHRFLLLDLLGPSCYWKQTVSIQTETQAIQRFRRSASRLFGVKHFAGQVFYEAIWELLGVLTHNHSNNHSQPLQNMR